jgi:hypothetical protein
MHEGLLVCLHVAYGGKPGKPWKATATRGWMLAHKAERRYKGAARWAIYKFPGKEFRGDILFL